MRKNLLIAVTVFSLVSLPGSALAAVTPPPPSSEPTTVEECKKGGWQNYGGLFKNQGDCVSYVVTGGRNQPSGNL